MATPDRLAAAIESQAFDLPANGPILVLRAQPGPALALIDPGQLLCEQSFRPLHDRIADSGRSVTALADGPAAMVMVQLTRSRAENLGNVARGLSLLAPGGTLVVDGAKVEGIDSLARQLGAILPLSGQMTKAHGRVIWLTRPEILPDPLAQWAEAAAPRRNADGFLTTPGLFSADGIDPGSRRLANFLAGRLRGRVADLGAGWGWLAVQALEQAPSITQIDLYEAEARALDMARLNLTDPRAGFHWVDVETLSSRTAPYDTVISNPPFHQTRAAEPDLGARFIAAAARILKPSGQLLMVANRQLPYEAALDARFRQWERLSEDGAFKVILAARPRRDESRRT